MQSRLILRLYTLRMSHNETFTIERRAIARSTPDAVFARLLRPATWPSWQEEIITVLGPEEVAAGDVVGGRARMLGFEVDGQTTAMRVDTNGLEQSVVVGVGMRIDYQVKEVAEGVEITHRLSSDLPRGNAGRILSFFLRRRLRRMQKDLLKELVAQVEAS